MPSKKKNPLNMPSKQKKPTKKIDVNKLDPFIRQYI